MRVSISRPLTLSLVDFSGLSTHELQARAAEARVAMTASDAAASNNYRAFEYFSARADKAFCAEELWQGGLRVAAADQFDLATGTLDDTQATQHWAAGEQRTLAPALDRHDRAASTRLACGLVLAARRDPPVDVRALTEAFDAIARALPYALELPRYLNAQHFLRVGAPPAVNAPTVPARIEWLAAKASATAAKLCESLGDGSYPLADVKEPTTLLAWCGFEPDVLDFDAPVVLNRVTTLYWELLIRIVSIVAAEEAETVAAS